MAYAAGYAAPSTIPLTVITNFESNVASALSHIACYVYYDDSFRNVNIMSKDVQIISVVGDQVKYGINLAVPCGSTDLSSGYVMAQCFYNAETYSRAESDVSDAIALYNPPRRPEITSAVRSSNSSLYVVTPQPRSNVTKYNAYISYRNPGGSTQFASKQDACFSTDESASDSVVVFINNHCNRLGLDDAEDIFVAIQEVTCHDATGDLSSTYEVRARGQPFAPASALLAANNSINQVVLTWVASPYINVLPVDKYAVYRWTGNANVYPAVSDKIGAFVDKNDALQYTDSNLENGITYYYGIRAVYDVPANEDDVPALNDRYSEMTIPAPSSAHFDRVNTVDPDDFSLTYIASSTSNNNEPKVTLSWIAPTGSTSPASFQVWRSMNSGSAEQLPVSNTVTDIVVVPEQTDYTFDDTTVIVNTSYTYYIVVIGTDDRPSIDNPELSITLPIIQAPHCVQADDYNDQITLTWRAPRHSTIVQNDVETSCYKAYLVGFNVYAEDEYGDVVGSPLNGSSLIANDADDNNVVF